MKTIIIAGIRRTSAIHGLGHRRKRQFVCPGRNLFTLPDRNELGLRRRHRSSSRIDFRNFGLGFGHEREYLSSMRYFGKKLHRRLLEEYTGNFQSDY